MYTPFLDFRKNNDGSVDIYAFKWYLWWKIGKLTSEEYEKIATQMFIGLFQ